MRPDTTQTEPAVALASGAPAIGAGSGDGTVALPRIAAPLGRRLALPRAIANVGPRSGRIALAVIVLAVLVTVVFATAQPSSLVPTSTLGFPSWESGPLHGLFGHLVSNTTALRYGLSAVVIAMAIAYGIALLAVRTLSLRVIVLCIVAAHLLLLLAPPMQLTDLFNYLGYARLGAVHHINPYVHGIAWEQHDPVFRFSTWHHLRSPYGYLFTAISYPIALLPMPVAYWVLKTAAVLLSLVFIALVYKCARLLGRDPRFAVLFVGLNPIYLMYAVGGFHNDFFMLVPSTAAVAFLLARRDRSAGAAVMVAVAVKFTAVLLLPFLLIAARPPQRRLRVLQGVVLATIPLVIVTVALFGFTVPNLQDQSTLLTDWSIPNVVGDLIGVGGGTPLLLRIANVALVGVVLHFLRRRSDWIAGAGWSTLALVASLAWLVPWYVIWVLPLAALGSSLRLRRAAIAFTAYLVLAFMPMTGYVLSKLGIHPMGGSAGQASRALQAKLEK